MMERNTTFKWQAANTQSPTMFFNACKFKDGSGDTVSKDETDYVLTALALVWRPDFKLLGGLMPRIS